MTSTAALETRHGTNKNHNMAALHRAREFWRLIMKICQILLFGIRKITILFEIMFVWVESDRDGEVFLAFR
jgi:hypothetical protein